MEVEPYSNATTCDVAIISHLNLVISCNLPCYFSFGRKLSASGSILCTRDSVQKISCIDFIKM